MQTLRIAMDIRAAQLSGGARGIGRYVTDLINGVARLTMAASGEPAGYEFVLIVLPDRPLPERIAGLPPTFCRIVPLPTRRINANRRLHRYLHTDLLYCKALYRQHRRGLEQLVRREKIQVLHLPSVIDAHFFSDGDFTCRVVKTLHDLIPMVFPDQYLKSWSRADRFVYQTQADSLRRADCVVAISESARTDAIKLLELPESKICVVPNSVSDTFAGSAPDHAAVTACCARYGIRRPYFLYCSGGGYTKNQERIVQAFGKFVQTRPEPPCQLVFVGSRGSHDTAHLRQVAAQTAGGAGLLPEQFLITGFVPDADLVLLMAGAVALVTPSLYEGFGLPAVEAMQVGTPVIASDRSSQPEVVGDAGLLVDPYSTDAIAGALERLAAEPNLRVQLSERGKVRAERFSWQNQVRAMLAVFAGEAQRAIEIRSTR